MSRIIFTALASLLLAACGSTTGTEGERVLAHLYTDDAGNPHVHAPDTVSVGQSFTVTLETYWPESGTEMEGTEVESRDTGATIRPYLRDGVGPCCYQAFQNYTHTATLQFDQPGTATLTIQAMNGGWDLAVVVR